MTLADALAGLAADPPMPNKGPKCYVCRWLEEATPEERAAFELACANNRVTSSALARTLSDSGHSIPEPSVARHRRGFCRGATR